MNQILYTQKKQNKKGNKLDIKGIVLFFAIAVILFGGCLTAQGVYAMLINQNKTEETPTRPEATKPNIDIQKQENEIIVTITHNKPISQVTYNWNQEEERTIVADNKTTITQIIELPTGTNTFNLTVVDINQEQTTCSRRTR